MKGEKSLIYEEESYQIIEILYDVYNDLGFGHKEKLYQKAIAKEFENNNILFRQQLRANIEYKKEKIDVYILDFLVFEKIVIGLKQGRYFSRKDITQLFSYLKATGLKLGLLAYFTEEGIKIKRIMDLK